MDFIFNVMPSWIKTFRVKKYAKELVARHAIPASIRHIISA